MRHRLLLALLGLALAGCVTAPAGTTLTRFSETIHHVDHPGVLLYTTPEGYYEPARISLRAVWTRDAKTCSEASPTSLPWDAMWRQLWGCLWAKGWRWETTAAQP